MVSSRDSGFDKTLELIEFKIFTTALKPRERLIERELMAEYGISRGTVRQVLKALAAKHLVIHHPNRGALVAEPSEKEVHDIYRSRVLLESYALDSVVACIQSSTLEAIRSCEDEFERALQAEDLRGLFHYNRLFHGTIFAVCDNAVVVEMIDQLRKRSHIWYRYFSGNPQHRRSSIEEHKMMIACLEERNLARLKRINKRHLTRGYQRYQEDFKNSYGSHSRLKTMVP